MRSVLILLLLSFFLTGCFRKWSMTDREIKEYYAGRKNKPAYFTVTNDSVALFCATMGADTLPPLLIIHGAPGAWYGSRKIMDDTLLNNRFHMIAVDRLGYDRSKFKNKKKPVTSIPLQATAIHEALKLNKSEQKAFVLGSSYGAPIAAQVAITYPGEFSHLFLLAGALDPEREKFWWWHRFIHGGPVYWLMPKFIRTATVEKFSHVKELRQLDERWKDLTVPATVVQGDADRIVDPQNLDYAKKRLKDKKADFILINGAGHMLRIGQSALIRDLLIRRQEELDPGRSNAGLPAR
jgi:pimeloyl-ACP methyl ester carboxylesterase